MILQNASPRRRVVVTAALIAVFAVCAVLLRWGYLLYWRSVYPLEYTEFVESYAGQYGFEPSLIYGVIYTESGFRPEARSHAGAMGLMQITKDTFEWAQQRTGGTKLDTEQLYDPETNIKYGVIVLSLLREQFEDTTTMLAAYNAGMGNVRGWLNDADYSGDGVSLDNIPWAEPRNYVKKVPAVQKMYQKLYESL